jgi:hypothetical protein
MGADKQHAHELIDRLDPSQVSAAIGLLESLLDPASRTIAPHPIDNEPESNHERQTVAESKGWFKRRGGKGIPHNDVLADFGLTPSDLKDK